MEKQKDKVTVYYDGSCPKCVRDRQNYVWALRKQGKLGLLV